MKSYSLKKMSRKIAIVLTLAMILTSSICTLSVSAESKPDLKKTNVKWDLKNNKKLKFKTNWYALGVKEHTVKMTKFKNANSKNKKGYKECTFTLTFNRDIKPTKNQILKMGTKIDETGSFGGDFYCAIVDYKTGKSLEGENDKDVTVTTKWNHSNFKKRVGKGGSWIRIARKSTLKVKIVYPASYKNLAVGVGGMMKVNPPKSLDKFWKGTGVFSKQTSLWNKKYGKYVHFMRINNK